MKRMRTLIVAATTITVAALAIVTLAGCTNAPHHEDSYKDDPMYNQTDPYFEEPSTIYVNEDTGKVTKFIDGSSKKIIFEAGYSQQDTKFQYASGSFQPYGDESIATTVMVDSKPYPVTTMLQWSWIPLDLPEQITVFNANFAAPGKFTASTPPISISGEIQQGVTDAIQNAIKQGTIPSVQYQTTGRTVTTADERIVAGWKAGTPAWKTLQDIEGSSVSSERYSYSFACATYDVGITNAAAVLKAIKAVPHADLFNFSLNSDKSQLLIETAQPCGIQASMPAPEVDGISDGYIAPPTEAGNGLPDKYVPPAPPEQKDQSQCPPNYHAGIMNDVPVCLPN